MQRREKRRRLAESESSTRRPGECTSKSSAISCADKTKVAFAFDFDTRFSYQPLYTGLTFRDGEKALLRSDSCSIQLQIIDGLLVNLPHKANEPLIWEASIGGAIVMSGSYYLYY